MPVAMMPWRLLGGGSSSVPSTSMPSESSPKMDIDSTPCGSARGSASYQSLLAALPEDDTCAVCYGVRCQPARLSDKCEHTFCRTCVLKCIGSSFARFPGCPLCRAPLAASLESAVLPSEIAFDQAAAASLAATHPVLYQCALEKEKAEEARLREKLIPNLPLVMAPGSCVRDDLGRPVRLRVRSTLTLFFSDADALHTLQKHQKEQVGILFRESSSHGGARRGFLARPIAGKYVDADSSRTDGETGGGGRLQGTYRTKLTAMREFQLVGNVRRDADGSIVGAVEVS